MAMLNNQMEWYSRFGHQLFNIAPALARKKTFWGTSQQAANSTV